MPLNLLKIYSDLLDLSQFNDSQRKASLLGVFKNHIEENQNFNFRKKAIRPIKNDDGVSAMQTLFHHLTTVEDKDENGKKLSGRRFELARSLRLHWIKYHIEERKQNNVELFSYEDRVNGKNVIRTYIYDTEMDYVVILEPFRKTLDYFLLTAYHLNQPGGKKQMVKKLKQKLPQIY